MPNSPKKKATNNSDSFDKFNDLMKKLIKVPPKEVKKPRKKRKKKNEPEPFTQEQYETLKNKEYCKCENTILNKDFICNKCGLPYQRTNRLHGGLHW